MPTRTLTCLLVLSATSAVHAEPTPPAAPAQPQSEGAKRTRPRSPPPDAQAPAALLALRSELKDTALNVALQQPRFRPLCDEDGYPLVGNIASKGTFTQPSAYCASVRRPRS